MYPSVNLAKMKRKSDLVYLTKTYLYKISYFPKGKEIGGYRLQFSVSLNNYHIRFPHMTLSASEVLGVFHNLMAIPSLSFN